MAETFVLLHGAWHGGWCWGAVADLLRARGHRVFTPSFTGLGDRAHLLTKTTGLDTHIADIAELFRAEALSDAVVVAHSYAGGPATGFADRRPEPLKHLIYLDASIMEDGQCLLDLFPPEIAETRRAQAVETPEGPVMTPPEAAAFGLDRLDGGANLKARLTPHPLKAYTEPLRLAGPPGGGVACAYIACTRPAYAPLEGVRASVRARVAVDDAWSWHELAAPHDAMIARPGETADLLEEIVAGGSPRA